MPDPTETSRPASSSSRAPALLTVVSVVLVLGVTYLAYGQYQFRREFASYSEQANAKLNALEIRATTMEDHYAELKGQVDVAVEKLGLTQEQLAKARAVAQQAKEEQRRTAEQLHSLTGEVGTVKGDVAATRKELETTKTQLQSVIGDLGEQSGLIARSWDELQELKKRGQRDYFEFYLKKSKQFNRVGSISVQLNKVDAKKQKFTLTLLVNDKKIEKKDKTIYEPLQFQLYPGERGKLLELVVIEVEKDRIAGYLSVPKEVAKR